MSVQDAIKIASKFLSHWQPAGRNFGAPKNMGGLCFQVLGSQGVLGVFGVFGVLGVFVFKTPIIVVSLSEALKCDLLFGLEYDSLSPFTDYGPLQEVSQGPCRKCPQSLRRSILVPTKCSQSLNVLVQTGTISHVVLGCHTGSAGPHSESLPA